MSHPSPPAARPGAWSGSSSRRTSGRLIEERCGSPVVAAVSQGGGFTPGFASVLTCEDGSRHFVKAASVKAQRLFAESYREEARKLAALPGGGTRRRGCSGSHDDDWVVLGIEYVDGAAARPALDAPPTSTPPSTRSRRSPPS